MSSLNPKAASFKPSIPKKTKRRSSSKRKKKSKKLKSIKKSSITNDNNKQIKKQLIVLRGLPGSGKTYYAKKLIKKYKKDKLSIIICCEDKYHWSSNIEGIGQYKFNTNLVFLARKWCNNEIKKAINNNINVIIIDNHNSRISMYDNHIKYGAIKGYQHKIIEFMSNEMLIQKYINRSNKQFSKGLWFKLYKLWEKDDRSIIIKPKFSSVSNIKDDHKMNAYSDDNKNDLQINNVHNYTKEKIDNPYYIGGKLQVNDIKTLQWIDSVVINKANNFITVEVVSSGEPSDYNETIHIYISKNRLRTISNSMINSIITKQWRITKIFDDNNGLYGCFAIEIYGYINYLNQIKSECNKYINDNIDYFKEEKDKYNKSWHEIIIIALSELYNVGVKIYEYNDIINNIQLMYNQPPFEAPCYLPIILLAKHNGYAKNKSYYNIINDSMQEIVHKRPLGIPQTREQNVLNLCKWRKNKNKNVKTNLNGVIDIDNTSYNDIKIRLKEKKAALKHMKNLINNLVTRNKQREEELEEIKSINLWQKGIICKLKEYKYNDNNTTDDGGINDNNNDKSQQHNKCVVCLYDPAIMICIPCGHIALCGNCASQIIKHQSNKCPFCGIETKNIIRCYHVGYQD